MGSLSKIQSAFKALVTSMPEKYWFGVTHLSDEDESSFAAAVGSSREAILKHLQQEGLGRTYRKNWSINKDRFEDYVYETLELPRDTYQITTGQLPGDSSQYLYIAKNPKIDLSRQIALEGMAVPTWALSTSRPTRTREDAELLEENRDGCTVTRTKLYTKKGRPLTAGERQPYEIPNNCSSYC